jgi:uncharacterized membrane protein YccC
MRRRAARYAEALMKRFGLTPEDLTGVRFAINVALATAIVWYALRAASDSNPIWAIASMIAASDPDPEESRRLFKCRLVNVAVGCVAGLVFLVAGGARSWVLPLSLATTVLVSSYLVRIKTMWRQAPITAALVIATGTMHGSVSIGVAHGLKKVAEVVFGCLVGMAVSLVMSKVWLLQPFIGESGAAPAAGGLSPEGPQTRSRIR